MDAEPSHRLPATVRPTNYDLWFAPDLDAATFDGKASIGIVVDEPVDELVLHALDLEIDRAVLQRGDRFVDLHPLPRPDTEMVALHAPVTVDPGEWMLHLSWRGKLNDQLVGFYRSTYTDDAGTMHTIACTQFESTHARRAFPCWDEPAFKASFDMSLLVDNDLLAVSNGAEVSSDPAASGKRLVRFSPTIPMSTYLVAMVVGPLEATHPVDVDGVPMRVITPLGRLHLSPYAQEVGAFALRHLTDWYGIPYPGDKIDLVAIPDFSFGAMENQGCITFRETALLLDREQATRSELMRVADVIAHELAHMWFGNLVTMAWWEGIWLNEAFATFMELDTTDGFRPDWQRWVEFGRSRSAAFDTDSLTTTRPIEFAVVTAEDAEAMFDVLTYEKGSSLVRMLQRYLGEERFRDGIRRYLGDHVESNTVTTDLWDAIESATEEPVRRMMDTWIHRGGHPVVSIERDGDQGLRLRQQRFTYEADAAAGVEPTDETDRAIPLVLRLGHGTDTAVHRVLLDGAEQHVALDQPVDWIVGNNEGDGFYRVELQDDDLAAVASVAVDRLGPLERYGLVEDEWALLLAGRGSVDRVLTVIRALATDDDLAVWQRIVDVLDDLDRRVSNGTRPRFSRFVRSLLEPVAARLGESDDDRRITLRAHLDVALALLGADHDRLRTAVEVFLGDDPGAGGPEMADARVRIAGAHGSETVTGELRRRADAADTAQDRLRHLGALADSTYPHEVVAFCELVLTDEVRTQDGPFLLRRALSNRHAQQAVWDFLEARWVDILDRFPNASIPRLLEGIRTIGDRDLAERVAAFLDGHPSEHGGSVIAQHRERMWVEVAAADRLRRTLDEVTF